MSDTSTQLASATMMMLAVHTVQVDTTLAIKPIIGPLKVPVTFREMVPWILAGLAVILLITGIIWYLRKRKKQEPVFNLKPKVVLLPHERALNDFEKLRVKKLWQAGRVKEYHSEVTEILRRYIEEHFKVPALEQTSAEITDSLKNLEGCRPDSLSKLNRVLILADMVKFAKAQPLALENEQCLGDSVEFVNETTSLRNV
jgi:LPXTG-motif cell wall-anchored protein